MFNPKFYVGQVVRYIGKEGKWNPRYGAIGKVLKIGAINVDYLVEFDYMDIPMFVNFENHDVNFWYHEDELEAVCEGQDNVRVNSACLDWIRV